jgi:hypothetical protein
MVEYHVVRSGVDQARIAAIFGPRFEQFSVLEYWSTQARSGQRLGELLGAKNTFALIGIGYKGIADRVS